MKVYIARDYCGFAVGKVCAFCVPPKRGNYVRGWYAGTDSSRWIVLPDEMFPELTWEDEPIEIELDDYPDVKKIILESPKYNEFNHQ